MPSQLATTAAINFALNCLEPFEVIEFLKDWREGKLEPWPEFATYLDDQVKQTVEAA